MMKFLSLCFCLFLLPAVSLAESGVEFELQVLQADSAGADHLLLADTIEVLDTISARGFFLMLSTDIEIEQIDSAGVSFQVHAVTMGETPQNLSRRFRAEFGVPARLDGIEGKNGASYSFRLRPLREIQRDISPCPYSHRTKGVFRVTPSAYTNIYYLPNSVADFYWNAVKTLVDQRYELFRDINKFTLSGKYSLYLCPCLIPSVLWDQRFGTMIDPTTSSVFAIYSRDFNSAYPFVVLHAATLRNYGYTPPFLSEGLAGYLGFARYDMGKMLEEGAEVS
ncbi:hypothetical protein GF420_04665, partial [candidate division GN15 bacterium]|nr:hypothetical protein [candidate division GN15 bacterium]